MEIKSDYPINDEALRDFKALTNEYDVLTSIETVYNKPQKSYLEDTVTKKCRFCKREYPNVRFNKIAHAIPEFTGNKSLVAKFECDNCNQYFSQFESEFANFMLPFSALGGVKKKENKYPKYKQNIIVHHPNENSIHVSNYPSEIKPNSKEIELELDIPSYIPEFIYRCLIKIGLTIIPEKTVEKYKEVLDWLMNTSSDTIFPASMLFSIFPFSNPSDKIRCVIMSRKEGIIRLIPDTLLVFSYQNFSFQTFFPILTLESKKILIPFPYTIPSPLDLNLSLAKQKEYSLIELSKKEKIKGKKAEFVIKPIDESTNR